ncbi:hypothetical protein RD792_017421 [Penstemon davidsonii]|uniref:GH10 domain-containing protein n=1 Tax=Penstemon davidsonii TaxID=160366 RepID=A0ABR0CMQ1_9LAMI|nr:hypothetical protein RD792_017421 [Penstemon davidsonii]
MRNLMMFSTLLVLTLAFFLMCKLTPVGPLYDGGLLKNQEPELPQVWIKITNGSDSALICAGLKTENSTLPCIGTVIGKQGCWSFLKGGFELSFPSNSSNLYIQSSDGQNINISTASASLQPFTEQQWISHQDLNINEERKRYVVIEVSDSNGMRTTGATITIEQVSKDFPFGSAIAYTIIGNIPYQKWFADRFNIAVMENELKWIYTEPIKGQVNYTIPDLMLDFLRAKGIVSRGHTVLHEDKRGNPKWVWELTGSRLQSAVDSRINSLMTKYRGKFIHWDVNNEELHYDFLKLGLGENATLQFFKMVHEADPLAMLFENEFNVVESCTDSKSTVDKLIARMTELKLGGATMLGMGLQSHFGLPNLPLMRATLDKLGTLGIPVWLTELDVSDIFSQNLQAEYLDAISREAFSHPSVKGIVLWAALSPHPNNKLCYKMCLTDENFNNLPAGDVVDSLLKEWQTGFLEGITDANGVFTFDGFLGEYKVAVNHFNKAANFTFYLSNPKYFLGLKNANEIAKQYLEAHNKERARVNVPPLQWNNSLVEEAERYGLRTAQKEYGENITEDYAPEEYSTSTNQTYGKNYDGNCVDGIPDPRSDNVLDSYGTFRNSPETFSTLFGFSCALLALGNWLGCPWAIVQAAPWPNVVPRPVWILFLPRPRPE